jgi:hypothetical protein
MKYQKKLGYTNPYFLRSDRKIAEKGFKKALESKMKSL